MFNNIFTVFKGGPRSFKMKIKRFADQAKVKVQEDGAMIKVPPI